MNLATIEWFEIMNKVNLREKLAQFSDHWKPKIVGELNGQHVKLVKLQGDSFGTSMTPRTNSSWSFRDACEWTSAIDMSGSTKANS